MAYQGPGDIVSTSWVNWWGLRAFSAAAAGGNAIRVRGNDAVQADIATLASGDLDVATLTAFITAHGAPTTIVTWYDQVGANNPTQATVANQAAVTLNSAGTGLTGATLNRTNSQRYITAGNITTAFPLTLVAVQNSVSANEGTGCGLLWSNGTNQGMGIGNTTGPFTFSDSVNLAAGNTAFDNALHSLQGIITNTASQSIIRVDASTTIAFSANPTATALSGTFTIGASFGANFFGGVFYEGGINAQQFNSTQYNNLGTNMVTYWTTPIIPPPTGDLISIPFRVSFG